jgi:phenylacetate-CoA ligase
MHYGAERIGATVLPTSVGNTERQIELMQDLGATAIACTPSYLLHMGEVAEKMGVSIRKDTRLRTGILGAEPWTERMRIRIEDWLGIKAYDIYGTSELSGPMFTECTEQKGFHIWSDIALVEIIDPKTEEPLEAGEKGELTITILQKEALPMIRYRIGDITTMENDTCACGRTHPRIQRIQGRVDDMLIIRGINVFPSQIEAVLVGVTGIEPHYQLIVDRAGTMVTLEVQVEVSEKIFANADEVRSLQNLEKHLVKDLKDYLGVSAKVKLVEPKTLQRFEGKASRVIDKRKI